MRRALDRPGDGDPQLPLEHFGQQDLNLQLGKPGTDTAVDAEAERQVAPRVVAIDAQPRPIVEDRFVAIGGQIPQHDLVALAKGMAVKIDILDRISDEFKPKTLFVLLSTHLDTVFAQMAERGLTYPIIAKPDVGERGCRVEKIEHWEDLVNYAQGSPADFLLQAYVDEPLELGVFYYRMPGEKRGVVSSIVQKEFLTIRGNGRNCIEELIG